MSRVAATPVGKTATVAKRAPAIWVTAISLFVAASIVGVALEIRGKNADAARRQAEQEALTAAAAEQAKRAEEAAARKMKQDADRRKADIAAAIKMSAAMDRARRDKWLWQCFAQLKCQQWQVDAIIDGAPNLLERERAFRVSYAASAHGIAREHGKDGTTLSAVPGGLSAGLVARPMVGIAMLELMPHTTVADAMKDPETARGGVLRAAGTIVEIRTEGGVTEGTLATGALQFIRFVTAMSTNSLYADSWASFVGVFVQEYDFMNVSGGQTKSLLVVGAFDRPENHTSTNGPEPPRGIARPVPFRPTSAPAATAHDPTAAAAAPSATSAAKEPSNNNPGY